jgi:hypothetical protein
MITIIVEHPNGAQFDHRWQLHSDGKWRSTELMRGVLLEMQDPASIYAFTQHAVAKGFSYVSLKDLEQYFYEFDNLQKIEQNGKLH